MYVESPYVSIGAAATAFYFARFLFVVPFVGIIYNILMDISLAEQEDYSKVPSVVHSPIIS